MHTNYRFPFADFICSCALYLFLYFLSVLFLFLYLMEIELFIYKLDFENSMMHLPFLQLVFI